MSQGARHVLLTFASRPQYISGGAPAMPPTFRARPAPAYGRISSGCAGAAFALPPPPHHRPACVRPVESLRQRPGRMRATSHRHDRLRAPLWHRASSWHGHVARRLDTAAARVMGWRDALWWSSVQVVDEVASGRADRWRHPPQKWTRLPDTVLVAWAGPEWAVTSLDRDAWRSSASGWLRFCTDRFGPSASSGRRLRSESPEITK